MGASAVSLNVDSQFPLLDQGFTPGELDPSRFKSAAISASTSVSAISTGTASSRTAIWSPSGGYYRINDNWAFSFGEQYEFETSTLEAQTYQVSRDLSSWVASFGLSLEDDGGKQNVGVILTFTLKDLPSVRLPVTFDPEHHCGPGGKQVIAALGIAHPFPCTRAEAHA